MKKNKNNLIIIVCVIILVVILGALLILNVGKGNLEKTNYDNINKMVENKENFVLCVSRTTCEHCKEYKPKLKNIANQYNIKIYYIDIDSESKENQEKFSSLFNVESTPTTIFVKNGEETTTASRIVGDVSIRKITSSLKSNGFIK